MAKNRSQNKGPSRQIADNRKARFDFQLEYTIEAGLVLEGWEVKSLRAGHAQLKESYVMIKNGEMWLISRARCNATLITECERKLRPVPYQHVGT